MSEILGGCLCEKVRYKISQPPLSQGICYCHQCQKVGGVYGSPLVVLRKDALKCSDATLSFCKTQSHRGSTVTRNFCRDCGTHIFAQISDVPEFVTVRAATFDDFRLFVPQYLVWTGSVGPSCDLPVGVLSFAENAPLEVLLGS